MFVAQIPIIFTWIKNLILVGAGVASILFFVAMIPDNWDKYQSRNWPAVDAQIDSAKVSINDETDQGYMEVGYSYIVDNQLFTREITDKSSKKSPLSAKRKQEWRNYLTGNDIKVYYKPSVPKTSVIASERTLYLKDFLFLLFGAALILLLGGLACIFVGIDGFKTKS